MPLVNPINILNKAKKENKGIGAFNVLSLEMIQAAIGAAEETNTPIILQVSASAMNWAKFNYMVPMILSAARTSKIDVAVHLDHCQDIDLLKQCVKVGFSSVMYDGSHLNFKKNIEKSKEVIAFCKNKALIEIEIGKIGGKEDDIISKSNDSIQVEDALNFYKQTKPDILAIAFGTTHGIYRDRINLDLDLIRKSSKIIPIPLAMHGTSGIPFKTIKKAIRAGVTKINVGTDILIANFKAIRKYLNENPKAYDIRKINTVGIISMKKRIIKYINLFNKTL